MIRPRPFLCPGPERDSAKIPWVNSKDNAWWKPRSATYPSSDQFLPGDIILFSPRKPNAVQKVIQAKQRAWGASEDHARFTHVAIYIGVDHLICEALLIPGVTYSTLETYLDQGCWMIRRWPARKGCPHPPTQQR